MYICIYMYIMYGGEKQNDIVEEIKSEATSSVFISVLYMYTYIYRGILYIYIIQK